MKNKFMIALVVLNLLCGMGEQSYAQLVTEDEATTVARTWIAVIIRKFGSWGEHRQAAIQSVHQFTRGSRQLGYLINVNPSGHIVVSLRKEFLPIAAYSTSSHMDPMSNAGWADFIKLSAERDLNAVETRVGLVKTASTQSVALLFEADNRPIWSSMLTGTILEDQSVKNRERVADYVEGDYLVTTAWHQNWPFNAECPDKGCTEANQEGHAKVGCVATAAAQIMRYFCWPPFKTRGTGIPGLFEWTDTPYDWVNMPDTVKYHAPGEQVMAVAHLCADIGARAGMDYGCGESTAWMYAKPGIPLISDGADMLDAYKTSFAYASDGEWEIRGTRNSGDWFGMLRNNINANRPLQYAIVMSGLFGGHSMVCDGWQVTAEKLVHMNYGWADGDNGWYAVGEIKYSLHTEEEAVLINVRPINAVGPTVHGSYDVPFYKYRNFDRSAIGTAAEFSAGQKLHFIPGVSLKNSSQGSEVIKFYGWSDRPTTIFTQGTESRGIHLTSGHIYVYSNGGFKFPKR